MCRWGVSHTSSEFKDNSHENGAAKVGSRCGESEQEGVLASSDLAHPPSDIPLRQSHVFDPGSPGVHGILAWVQTMHFFCIPRPDPFFEICEPFPRHCERIVIHPETIGCSNRITQEKLPSPVVLRLSGIRLAASSGAPAA